MFSTHDIKYIWYLQKSFLFILYFYKLHAMSHPMKMEVLKMKNEKSSQTRIILVPKYSSRSN